MKLRRKPKPAPAGVLEYTFKLDFRPFVGVIQAVMETWGSIAQTFTDLFAHTAESRARLDKRLMRAHGLGNGAYGAWRSDMCAVWLHDDCAPAAGHLCSCGCHRGD